MRSGLLILVLCWMGSQASVVSAATRLDQVKVASGMLQGSGSGSTGVRAFLGVPYAAPLWVNSAGACHNP